MSEPQISAIICTHNREGYLGAAIDSLLEQDFPGDYEVIVVDNASTDRTHDVVKERSPHPRLRYVYEATVGLSVARNTGAAIAKAPILAYLDDDAEATPQWLRSLHQIYQTHERVAIAGGKVTLLWPPGMTPPQWLSDELASSLGLYNLGDAFCFIEKPGLTPRGLNYSIRRTFLEQIGGFDLNLGRVGTRLLSNEELHMTQRALETNWQVAYSPDALVAHNVAPERMYRRWFLNRSWWQGISEYYRETLTNQSSISSLEVTGSTGFLGSTGSTDGWQQLGRGSERFLRGIYNATKYVHQPARQFDNLVYAYGQIGYLKSVLQGILDKNTVPRRSPKLTPE